MPGVIAALPKFLFSTNGAPMVGGTLTSYIAGSTTPATTWQDAALTIANTNPITLDARGECVLWLDSVVIYKFILKNAQGVIQWTQDNINSVAPLRTDLAASLGASLIGGGDQVVSSITALRALLKTNASKNAFATGYYASGDGGGGAYWLDAADVSSVDNGGTVIVATDGGRWKLASTGEVSARQFGAKGDGVTDDTAALQKWLDVCSACYLPNANPGQFYKTTLPLVIKRAFSLSIRGETREGAVIKKIGVTPSSEASVMCPAGLAPATLEAYNVDAVLIVKAPVGDFNRDINIDRLTLKRDTKAGYGLYAPRLSLSTFRDLDVFTADKGIYSASPFMVNWTRCTARDCRAGWILGDAAATNGGGTSNTLLSCWSAGTAIGRSAYDCFLVYSGLTGCGADYIGYADDGVTTGPTAAIYKFTNSNVIMTGCGTEEARGPIVLATNSLVSIDGFHSYHYYANWTGQTYQYAFVALAGSVVSVRNLDVVMEGASITIRWGLASGLRSMLSFYDNKTYPEINTYTDPLYAPITNGGGAVRITNAKHNYQSTSGGNGAAESSVIDGSFGSNNGQGTWNTGHLLLGQWHLWVDAGVLRIKASAPISTSDGSVVGLQT